jgi:hypothetical protein
VFKVVHRRQGWVGKSESEGASMDSGHRLHGDPSETGTRSSIKVGVTAEEKGTNLKLFAFDVQSISMSGAVRECDCCDATF